MVGGQWQSMREAKHSMWVWFLNLCFQCSTFLPSHEPGAFQSNDTVLPILDHKLPAFICGDRESPHYLGVTAGKEGKEHGL